MDFISSIISEELVYALGWTVVHSLWQAIGVAFIMGGLLLALQKHSSEVRYRLAYGALLVVLTMAVFTFFDLYQFARHKNVIEITQLSVQASSEYAPTLAEIPATATLPQRFTSYFNTHLPLIVSVWLLGLSLFVIRLLGGLAYLEHLKIAYTYQLETHWEDMLQYLAEQLPIKRTVELMESALVQVPIVVGHFKPIILMPVGAVNGLAVEQVEAILAHELAHIARNDYILNVVQSVIEALLYFNPAVWWISANIRTERENCCDDVAIQLCGNKLNYAKALVAIQEMNQSAPSLAMAFGKKKGQFLNRIRRILNQPQNKSDMIEKITATFLLLAVVLGLTVNAASPYHDKEFKTSETPALVTVVDTLPQKGTMNFTGRHNGQDVKTTVKNGKITYLKIDGKEIAETEYKDYEPLVEEIMENVPPPPPPPPAPMPPAPVRPGTPPPPPAPPAPKGGIYYSDDAALKELALVEVQMKRELEAQLVELKMQEAELREHLNKESSEEMKHRKELLEEEMKHLKEMADQARAEHEVALVEHKHEMVRHQEELKKMRAELELMEAKNKELKNRFGKELLNDGLIKSSDNYRINLSGKSMEVNGKAVSSSIADKYRKIFEEVTGGALCSDCQFTFGKGKEE